MLRAISECGGIPLSTSHAHAPRHMDIRRWGASGRAQRHSDGSIFLAICVLAESYRSIRSIFNSTVSYRLMLIAVRRSRVLKRASFSVETRSTLHTDTFTYKISHAFICEEGAGLSLSLSHDFCQLWLARLLHARVG